LRVISVSDSTHPGEIGYYDTPGVACNVVVMGDYAYVADFTGGLRIVSVSDPAHPTEVGFHETPGHADDVVVVGDYAYVADGNAGLQIYQFYGAGVEEGKTSNALRMTPVPTIIRGVLELAAVDSRQHTAYRAELLDATGRRVAELHSGPNDVSRFGAGVYFVRDLESGGGGRGEVSKVVIQR
jgi:hypothetical protein